MAAASTAVDLVHFFDYLVRARERLLRWIADAPSDVYERDFTFGLGSICATLVHVADIEWGYVQRLSGRDYTRAGDLSGFPYFRGGATRPSALAKNSSTPAGSK